MISKVALTMLVLGLVGVSFIKTDLDRHSEISFWYTWKDYDRALRIAEQITDPERREMAIHLVEVNRANYLRMKNR